MKIIRFIETLYALKLHDWRHRLRDMFEIIGLPLSECLRNELTGLEAKAAEVKGMGVTKSPGL